MPVWAIAAVAGLVGGLAASGVMNLYQSATGSLFGQDGGGGDDEPATVKAADDAKRAATDRPIAGKQRRRAAGSAVHYATGAALGLGYALLVLAWPPAAALFGAAFGVAVMLVLDDLLVPAFGWGPWPAATPLKTHLYSLTSHIVFGVVLEGVRRLGTGLLA